MIGDKVDCVIGSQFTPNGSHAPMHLTDRVGGRLVRWDEFGNAVVHWPNGLSFSYEAALLRKSDA
jgi:hypothetical protein